MTRRLALALIAAAVAAPAPAAEPLGRLFFTPAQRNSLDLARSQKTRVTVATEKPDEEPAAVPEVITYGGMVRRSDGKSTVWINSRALHDKEAASATPAVRRMRPDGSVTLQVPQSGQSVELKVGQSVELLSGSIEEPYARRPASAPEARPKPRAAAGPASPASNAAGEPPRPEARGEPAASAQPPEATKSPPATADAPRKGS